MADQNRSQQSNRNPNQQSSERREDQDNTQQTQGNPMDSEDMFDDDAAAGMRSGDRPRSNRERASIANDESTSGDRQPRRTGGDTDRDELDGSMEEDTDIDALDELDDEDEDLGSGGSNR